MGHGHHSWRVGDPLPYIRAHSLAKQRLLRGYLERYVSVLTARPKQDQFRLTLIDGFAGGGLYRDKNSDEIVSGSPLIMLEAMELAHLAAQAIRDKPFHLDAHFIFVEKNPSAFDHLKSVLENSRFSPMLSDRVKLLKGEFSTHADGISNLVKQRAGRSIFVLDQFGYKDVPLPIIRQILTTLPKAEVILTFAADSLIDYLSHDEATQRRLERSGISLPAQDIQTAKSSQDWRRTIQFGLHRDIPQQTEAKFYTPFFIRSTESHRDLWLIHLSGHYRARDVMMGLHWQESTAFAHYGRSGLRMLGYDPSLDSEWSGQQMLPGFFFDETARASSQAELQEQLPEVIHPFANGITFNELFAQVTNDCPVTAQIMMEVTGDLVREGLIKVRSSKGSSRRFGVLRGSDIVIPSRQKRLFLPRHNEP